MNDELNEHTIKPISMVRLQTPASKREGLDLSKYVVSYPNGTKIEQIQRDRLGCRVVKFEVLRRTTMLAQCRRCLGDQPSMRCNRTPRCVKCAGSHISADCTVIEKDSPKSAHCEQYGHPGNYQGCSVLKERRAKFDRLKEERKTKKTATGAVVVADIEQGRRNLTQATAATPASAAPQRIPEQQSAQSGDMQAIMALLQEMRGDIRVLVTTVDSLEQDMCFDGDY